MPELPEVETVVRKVRGRLVGRRIERVIHASPLMIEIADFSTRLEGRRIERLDRHGKWMFARLDDSRTLVLHLGMSGRMGVFAATAPVVAHTHLRLRLDVDQEEFRFIDPRRFGEVLLVDSEQFSARFGEGRLGPEPTTVVMRVLNRILQGTRRSLKALLLDQRAIAGIGNIYADEILFGAGLHPARSAAGLSASEAKRLRSSMRRVIEQAIARQGTTIHSFADAEGRPGGFQGMLKVYGRAEKPCKKCKTTIRLSREIIRGRATHWCPGCQPEDGSARKQPR